MLSDKQKLLLKSKPVQFLLNQKTAREIAYEQLDFIDIIDERKDLKLKQFNRKIIRNYILCTILGGLVGAGVMSIPTIKKAITNRLSNTAVENTK